MNQQNIISRCWHPSGIFAPFPREDIEISIPTRFEMQVEKCCHRLAIKSRKNQLTYNELNNISNCLAWTILNNYGDKENFPIGMFLDHDTQAIAAIMGILKSGKIYVPLAPSFPVSRSSYMLRDSRAKILVTDDKNLHLAKELVGDGIQIINIDHLAFNTPKKNPCLYILPDSYAYIIYTSGSTGPPKGVIGRHKDILHEIMRITNEKHICTEDRLTMFAPASVSGSIRDIFGSLLNGSSLFLYNIEEQGIFNIANWLIQNEISIYHSVVTLFREFVRTLKEKSEFPFLRLIRIGGEPVHKTDLELFKNHFSQNCIFLNGYGITETGTVRHYYMDKDTQILDTNIPVGYSVEDMKIKVLDDSGMDIGFGNIGEICVISSYISPGYWGKPDLTDKSFVPDPEEKSRRIYHTGDVGYMLPDGCLVHLGRKDFQIKIRGNRVEAAEVEAAIRSLKNIKDVVVIMGKSQNGVERLVAYYVSVDGSPLNVSFLRRALAEKLPDYMIPSVFVKLDNLPITPTGKLDRLSLPKPGTSRSELDVPYSPPRTPIEECIVEIWEQVLEIKPVGIYDNFFDLGGSSILAIQVALRVFNRFQIEVPLRSIFQASTVAEMASIVLQNQANIANPEYIKSILAELELLSEEEAKKIRKDLK